MIQSDRQPSHLIDARFLCRFGFFPFIALGSLHVPFFQWPESHQATSGSRGLGPGLMGTKSRPAGSKGVVRALPHAIEGGWSTPLDASHLLAAQQHEEESLPWGGCYVSPPPWSLVCLVGWGFHSGILPECMVHAVCRWETLSVKFSLPYHDDLLSPC